MTIHFSLDWHAKEVYILVRGKDIEHGIRRRRGKMENTQKRAAVSIYGRSSYRGNDEKVIKNPLFFSYFFMPKGKKIQRIGVEKKDVFLKNRWTIEKKRLPPKRRRASWIPARSTRE
ncbi:MAG TPA: hypothetical protein VKS81_03460 [Bacteroidota bacterium]|nr:hypothetical protein [Bacteroidota bacterium]